MSLLKFAQNIEYLIKIGVPVEIAPDLLAFLKSNPEDIKWMLAKIKEHPNSKLEQYKQIYYDTKERNKIDPAIIEWANKVSIAHSKWLIRLATNKLVRMGEDDGKLRAMLRNFEVLKERKLIPIEQRDILKYKSDKDLYETIKPFLMLGHSDDILIPEEAEGLLYSGSGIQILQVNDPNIASRFAQGTNWCVKNPETAQGYLNSGPLYFVFIDNRKSVLINNATGQIKETNDAPLKNYSIIRRVHPVLEQLGLSESTGGTYRDFEHYHSILEEGNIVNQKVARNIATGRAASEVILKLYPEVKSQETALLYLDDQYINDPSIQAICNNVFSQKLQTNSCEIFVKTYRDLPRNIQLIPGIFEICKERFTHFILKNPGTYSECSNDLKKIPEIQQAHYNGFIALVKKDPELNEADIPEEYRELPEMKKARYDGWLSYIRENPERTLPEDIANDPKMQSAQSEGWYEKLNREPESYKDCPEYIKFTDKAQGIVWDACIREVENDPREYYSKIPRDFQDDPYVRETVIKGWLNLIRKNPLHMYQCPAEFKNLDVIKNAYSKDADEIKEEEAITGDAVRQSQIRNWLERIKVRQEDYKAAPQDIRNEPEIFNIALQGWVERIKQNPYQINYCPSEFKKRPEIREQLQQRNPMFREQLKNKSSSSNWYVKAQLDMGSNIEISSIDGNDMLEIDRLLLAGFPQYSSWVLEYAHSVTNFSLSKKATINGKIVGCYLLGNRSINEGVSDEQMTPLENLNDYENKHGCEGVALVSDPEFRNQGIASKLKSSVSGFQYIWGLQLKGLNNLQHWLKRRRLVAESNSCYATLEDFQ